MAEKPRSIMFLKQKQDELAKLVNDYNGAVEARDAKRAELDAFAGSLDTEARSADDNEAALVALAVEELRTLTEKVAARGEEISNVEAQIATLENESKRRQVPSFVRGTADLSDVDTRNATPGEVRDAALRSIERADKAYLGSIGDPRADALERAISRGESKDYSSDRVARAIVATSKPAYERAFIKGLSGRADELESDERAALAEARAQSLTDNAGGYGVPVVIDPTILITNGQSRNPLIAAARVEAITNDEWKGVSSAHAAWSMDAEAAEVSDDAVTLAQPSIKTEKPQAFIPYSIEVGMDYPGFANQMGRVLSQGYTYLVAQQLAVGTGSTPQTTGIFVGASTTVDVATDNTLAAADIDAVYAATPEDFRANGAWVMNVDVENEIRAFGSGTATSRFTVDQTAEGITLLNGKPVVLTDHAPAWAGTDGQNVLVFGDMDNFVLAQRLGMTLSNIPFLFGSNQRPTGQQGLYGYARFGSDVVVANAFRRLKNITS